MLDKSRFLKILQWLVCFISLTPTLISAECEDEPLVPENDKHEVPEEMKSNNVTIYNSGLLYGDKVTVTDIFGYVDVGVKSELSPVKFANKKLTEVTVTVQGAYYIDVGYYIPSTNIFRDFKQHTHLPLDKESTLTTDMDETTTDEVLIRAFRSRNTDFKVSNMILKVCKELKPDIDDCKPDSCLNGGTCKDGINSFTCQCAEGFEGPTCANNINDCKPDSCLNGGTCKDEIDSFSCQCAEGYDGPTCANNINDCKADSCLNGGSCIDGINSFTCQCAVGFDGSTCENNIDDCKPDSCLNGGSCKDEIDSFTCQCAEGFDGPTCENNINDCKPDSCINGGSCIDGINSFTCQCAEGFDGSTCENNIDDCKPDSCLNGGSCKDEINSFTCQCAEGFDGPTCDNNINDCKPHVCLNGGICQDEINSFTCQCAEGFDGPTCENNINDCESSPCNYGGTCTDAINDFLCDCVTGYSGKTCEIAPRCQTIRCISKDCGYTECTLKEADVIIKATLKQSFKNSSCYYYGHPAPADYQGGDPGFFGYKDNAVWVDNGCKAIFEVCFD